MSQKCWSHFHDAEREAGRGRLYNPVENETAPGLRANNKRHSGVRLEFVGTLACTFQERTYPIRFAFRAPFVDSLYMVELKIAT